MYFFMLAVTLFLLIGCSKCVVTIKNNSPITIGTPITFEVNSGTVASTSLSYTFTDNTKNNKQTRIIYSYSILFQDFLYTEDDKIEGQDDYIMSVKVCRVAFNHDLLCIGESKTSFKLLDSLIVSLDVKQNNISHPLYLSTELPFSVISSIKDPKDYFSNAIKAYEWNISKNTNPTINYQCTEGPLNIMLNVTFILKDASKIYTGQAIVTRKCLNPIHNIKLKETHYIQIYKDLKFELSFLNATPPIYCYYYIVYHDKSTYRIYIKTETRQINFIHYFNKLGSYSLKIKCNNIISENSTEINFNVYDFTRKTPLYIVLLPIISIITAICIVFGVIALHLKYRKELTVEVANFDFQSYENLMEKTFFERIRESILDYLRFLRLCGSQRTYDNSDPNNLDNSSKSILN